MTIFFGKLASQLGLPLGFSLLLLGLALGILLLGRTRAAGVALATAILVLWGSSMRVIGERLVSGLEALHPALAIDDIAPADTILVLGGATQPAVPPRRYPELSEAGDRILHAARLYHAGKAPWILASGGRVTWLDDLPPEAITMRALLMELGVPEQAIRVETTSHDTHANCVASSAVLRELGASNVLLVTSAIHMRRALAACRTAGLVARPVPTDFWVDTRGARTAIDWSPTALGLLYTHAALRERLGYAVYRWRGWIAP